MCHDDFPSRLGSQSCRQVKCLCDINEAGSKVITQFSIHFFLILICDMMATRHIFPLAECSLVILCFVRAENIVQNTGVIDGYKGIVHALGIMKFRASSNKYHLTLDLKSERAFVYQQRLSGVVIPIGALSRRSGGTGASAVIPLQPQDSQDRNKLAKRVCDTPQHGGSHQKHVIHLRVNFQMTNPTSSVGGMNI